MNKTAYDVAVIGGGAAGLIASIDLAQAGKNVVMLEKSTQVGGRAITVNKNGALFNLGAHAIYRGGAAYAILQGLGLRLEGGSPQAKGFGIWNGGLVPLPGTPAKLLTSKLLSLSGKMEFGRFMMGLAKIDASSVPNISLREWAEREIRDPMVRHLFYALARTATYNKEIDRQLAGPVLLQVQRSLAKNGVLYLDGGWQTIVDQLRDLAVRSGVTILANRGVTRIEHDGTVRGLLLNDGETITVPRILSTVAPQETFRIVPNAENTALRRWKDAARPVMAACLDLALKRLPVPGRNFAIGFDQPVFFTNHSIASRLSDSDLQVVHLIKYNLADERDPKGDERLLERTMSLLHPDWQKEVVARQYLPSMTVSHDYMHIGRQDLLPGPEVPEIEGLYVAGDWASHGEWLLDAAAASARRASGRILRELAPTGASLAAAT